MSRETVTSHLQGISDRRQSYVGYVRGASENHPVTGAEGRADTNPNIGEVKTNPAFLDILRLIATELKSPAATDQEANDKLKAIQDKIFPRLAELSAYIEEIENVGVVPLQSGYTQESALLEERDLLSFIYAGSATPESRQEIQSEIEQFLLAKAAEPAPVTAKPLRSKAETSPVIDVEKNLWDEFARTMDLGETPEEQMHNFFGKIVFPELALQIRDPLSKEASGKAKLLEWRRPTKTGSVTLISIIETCGFHHGQFKEELKERIHLVDKILSGGHNWYEVYKKVGKEVSVESMYEHLSKYLLNGVELQAINTLGYKPLGINFFEITMAGIATYQDWALEKIYLTPAELAPFEPTTPEEQRDLELVLLDGASIPNFSALIATIDVKQGSFKDFRKFGSEASVLNGKLTDNEVVVYAVETFFEADESERQQVFRGKVIAHLKEKKISKLMADKQKEFGIFPVKEVGESSTRQMGDKTVSQIEYHRFQTAIPDLEAFISSQLNDAEKQVQLDRISQELTDRLKRTPTKAEVEDELKKQIRSVAEQADAFALNYYVGQGLTAKDDEITQGAQSKFYRLLETAAYRYKYPGQEGADSLKGTIQNLIPVWSHYASGAVKMPDGSVEAYSLAAIFRDPYKRKHANFSVHSEDARGAYLENGVLKADKIYGYLGNGLGFDPLKIGKFERVGGPFDRPMLVLDDDIIKKIEGDVARSTLKYWVSTMSTSASESPHRTEPGSGKLPKLSQRWQLCPSKGDPVYQMLIDFKRDGDEDQSMIRMSKEEKERFKEESERIGFESAMVKAIITILLENHFILKLKLGYLPSDDAIAFIYGLTGKLPTQENGKQIYTRFQGVQGGTPASSLKMDPDEALGILVESTRGRSTASRVIAAILGEKTA